MELHPPLPTTTTETLDLPPRPQLPLQEELIRSKNPQREAALVQAAVEASPEVAITIISRLLLIMLEAIRHTVVITVELHLARGPHDLEVLRRQQQRTTVTLRRKKKFEKEVET